MYNGAIQVRPRTNLFRGKRPPVHNNIDVDFYNQALDELGILPYLKRFSGASAGALPALFLSLGLDSEQVAEENDKIDMTEYFDASKYKYGYNLVKKMGFHPADKCIENIEGYLEKYTG